MKVVLKDFFIENDETYYLLLVEMKTFEWNIRKRFSQIFALYTELQRLYSYYNIPKLDKQWIGFKQEKRNEQLMSFINMVSQNFTLCSTHPFTKFIMSDIFVDSVEEFLAITKNKQKEYVATFLSESKISNYKNYITSLENQIIEIIDYKKSLIAQLRESDSRIHILEDENYTGRLQISSLTAENNELRRIYNDNKDNVKELYESIALVNSEVDSQLTQIKDLECLNRQFRNRIDALEEEKLVFQNRITKLELEYEKARCYIPSAPPMPEELYLSHSYNDSFSKPPSLK